MTTTSSEAPAPAGDVTRLLDRWSAGEEGALERLVPLVYGDLRRLAASRLGRERGGHTLQATAVVNELYLRLVGQDRVRWQNREQFFAVAATMMRRILVSYARRHRSAKRGSGVRALELDEALGLAAPHDPDLVELDAALAALAEFAPRQARIVELRYFGGLTITETAAILEVSRSTVKLDWSLARAWLRRELRRS